jgi:hypothetical protein
MARSAATSLWRSLPAAVLAEKQSDGANLYPGAGVLMPCRALLAITGPRFVRNLMYFGSAGAARLPTAGVVPAAADLCV